MEKTLLCLAVVQMICGGAFAASLVNNPGFELPVVAGSNNGGPIDGWNITSTGGGLTVAAVPSPMSGQTLWFNNSGPSVYQTLDGLKLSPNKTYVLSFDARVSGVADQTLDATIIHATGSGTSSAFHSNLVSADATDLIVSNGTYLAGTAGVRFDIQVTSTDNDPDIYHEFRFTTPATLSDPNAGVDLGIMLSAASGVQIQMDNVLFDVIEPILPSPLPFLETFEAPGVTNGAIDGQNGWISVGDSADVQSGIVYTNLQALQIQKAEISHDLSSTGSSVWLHFQARCTGIPDTIPSVSTNATLVFYVNTNLNLVVYSNTVPVELNVQVPTNVWTRFDIYCDYDDLYWDLGMDDINVAAGLPLYSTNTQLAAMTIGNGSSAPVYIDQIDIADTEQTAGGLPDSDNDEIPDWWEQKYFGGVTNVVAEDPSGNDGLTYLQAYIAGVSPFAFDPFVVSPLPGGNGLSWDPAESRLYSVYWTPNLMEAFTWQANLPYPESEFIDSVHSISNAGFYRLKVQVQ